MAAEPQRLIDVTTEQLRELLSEVAEGVPYYTQKTSPLGKEKHLLLLKQGRIPGWQVGRTFYARKSDVHAYIEAHPVVRPADDHGPDADEADTIIRRMGL